MERVVKESSVSVAQSTQIEKDDIDVSGRAEGGLKFRLAWDANRVCEKCGTTLVRRECSRNNGTSKRCVLLLTMAMGTVQIVLRYPMCTNGNQTKMSDSGDSVIFAKAKVTACSNEFLVIWLRSVVLRADTSREAYDYSRMKPQGASARLVRLGQNDVSCNRRRANLALGCFLRCLEYPNDSKLSNIFSCTACEKRCEDGRGRIRAIAMYESATGDLPKCKHPKSYIRAPRFPGRNQYDVHNVHLRRWVVRFFEEAGKRAKREFSPLWKMRW